MKTDFQAVGILIQMVKAGMCQMILILKRGQLSPVLVMLLYQMMIPQIMMAAMILMMAVKII